MPNGSTELRFYRGTDKVTFTSAGNIGIGVTLMVGVVLMLFNLVIIFQ